jgi:hypothetical protein
MPWMPASRESCEVCPGSPGKSERSDRLPWGGVSTPPRRQAGRLASGDDLASLRLSRSWRRVIVHQHPQKESVPWR